MYICFLNLCVNGFFVVVDFFYGYMVVVADKLLGQLREVHYGGDLC